MIEQLSIQNLILIEKAEIQFGPGLNIITGETGAGKSAILSAIRLILGERAELDQIRKGFDLAIVEAVIDGVLIRREIHRSKPSRCFIQDELVSLSELRTHLFSIELIDQSAAHKLSEHQIHYLDAFAKIDDSFAKQFSTLKEAENRLSNLLELKRSARIEQLENELKEIEEVDWKDEEEEQLAAEHHLLTHSQELLEKISHLTTLLSELSPLKRLTLSLESFPPLLECTEWLKVASTNLDEANRFLISYADQIELNPNRLFAVEKRLGQIEWLKRKMGSYAQVEQVKASLKTSIENFSNLDLDLETAQSELKTIQEETLLKAAALTSRRKEAAQQLSKAIVEQLIHLNLPEVRLVIEISPKPLSSNGSDEVRFLFAANPGSALLPIHQCASGGETSRLLFAIKSVLAGKEKNSCLIFDEIDGNIGGKTASILGAKLETMAHCRQLIAVTHFVQMARFAQDHFLVAKETTASGAKTTVNKLEERDKQAEYARMTGI